MWFTIDYIKDGESKRIISNWQGVMAFMFLNMQASEYREISRWVCQEFAKGATWASLQSDNGDSFEVYCPANESLPMSVEPSVVINPLRKFAQTIVSAIL